ncbi:hypothetical protein BDFB_011554 [Asbolus verrucosus]|uniref:Uncharacterized protein n=1 Tax=Asbolus verrucosus TaxID=1661398 RepID=A0A482WDE6_ASBVE|nr:hypothetical protein BDFB_011554 [Asbolus verrucosus]
MFLIVVFFFNTKMKSAPLGINQFSKIPSLITTYLGLDQTEGYTGHSFRSFFTGRFRGCYQMF